MERVLEPKKASRTEELEVGISLREVLPVDIHVRNISVALRNHSNGPRKIRKLFPTRTKPDDEETGSSFSVLLDNVSADMPHGSLTAIIGASGSGKTTLLNVLARRLDERSLSLSGTTTFNHSQELNVRYGYVVQEDCLIPTLTVRETLHYGAELRLQDAVSEKERKDIVEQTILELSLKECAATRVGSSIAKGCSGGEKRRTSIGIQLLQNPSVLFADEPTTGLDATSAHQVIQTLKDLARRGRTIVITIHQPRSEIWELFDRVILLAHGSCIYSGETKDCLPHFESLGYEIPAFVNPSEYLINLAAIDNRAKESETLGLERLKILKSAWLQRQDRSSEIIEAKSDLITTRRSSKVSIWKQFSVLTRRSVVVSIRDPKGLVGTILEALVVGVTLGLTFYNLEDSLQGIRSRQGAFYTASAVQGYLMLVYEIHRMTEDVQIFDREYSEGVINVTPFLFSRRVAKALEDIPMSLIYSLIFYFMVGLRPGATHFLIFFGTVLLIQLTAVSVAMFSVSVFRDFARSAMVGFAVFGYSNFGGGCFVPANELPVYVSWVKWISYIFYSYGAMNNNEFSGRLFSCQKPAGQANFDCIQFSGDFQLRSLGISLKIWQDIIALLGIIGVFCSAAGLIFFYFPSKVRMSKKPQSKFTPVIHTEAIDDLSLKKRQEVTISLKNYSLNVKLVKPWGVVSEKPILKQLTTTFTPGKLNVIMGPSGSGKTSLLSSVAGRLQNSFMTRYDIHGETLINDVRASTRQSLSMISLVAQDDDGLLPYLTVRETLRFAACLRLPDLSTAAKSQRAEDILLRMGLKDCANTLIGDELIKGISGGEKRRVSIAIQLLTDPQVLLLDEPTSGLDSFTAQSILQLLTEITEEGRTVILTIHQNQSDLFATNILLLARGGRVVYSGPGNEMLPYFRESGYECSERTNPGDFVLDIITVDLRHADKEAETKKRVDTLISKWTSISQTSSITSEEKAVTGEVLRLPDENELFQKSTASFTTAFPILIRRSALNLWRERNAMIARIMNVVPYGILIALFFAPLRTNYQAIFTRLGMIQLYCFMYFMGTLNNTAAYPLEKKVMYQEVTERAYTISPFFVSYSVLELPFTITAALLTAVVSAFPLGIRSTEVFFALFFDIFALISCGESLALALNSFVSDSGLTLSITNTVICVAQTMAGILSIDMPEPLKVVNYISPIKYVAANLAPYLLRGVSFDCVPDEETSDRNCARTQGDDILKLYSLNHNPRIQLAALGAVVVGYRLFAFLALYLRKHSWSQ